MRIQWRQTPLLHLMGPRYLMSKCTDDVQVNENHILVECWMHNIALARLIANYIIVLQIHDEVEQKLQRRQPHGLPLITLSRPVLWTLSWYVGQTRETNSSNSYTSKLVETLNNEGTSCIMQIMHVTPTWCLTVATFSNSFGLNMLWVLQATTIIIYTIKMSPCDSCKISSSISILELSSEITYAT